MCTYKKYKNFLWNLNFLINQWINFDNGDSVYLGVNDEDINSYVTSESADNLPETDEEQDKDIPIGN